MSNIMKEILINYLLTAIKFMDFFREIITYRKKLLINL